MQSPGGVLCKKGVHKKVCSVSRKALVLEFLFFNKAADWRPAALSKKKKIPAQVFFCEFCKISKNKYFEEQLRTPASSAKAHFS